MTCPVRSLLVVTILGVCGWNPELLQGGTIVTNPFVGVTLITRTETLPRTENMHIAEIDLTAPGIRFELTPPGGTLETVRQTTVGFLNQEHAQLGINSHFFLPFPSTDVNAFLIGLAASNGNIYSSFEAPVQSYAIVTDAPALNIDSSNQAGIVHDDTSFADGKHVLENTTLWTTVSGSAQIVTNGVKSIPVYLDATHPTGLLTPGGPASYSNSNSWYNLTNARTAIGLSQDNRTLFLFTVDNAGGSRGMTVGEVADLLISDYGVYNALNLDGGGSTTMAMENPVTGIGGIINVSSDNPNGRSGGSNLVVFAEVPEPASFALVGVALMALIAVNSARHNRPVCGFDASRAVGHRYTREIPSASWPQPDPKWQFHLGGWQDNWAGGMSDLRFYNFRLFSRCLSDGDVRTVYDKEFDLVKGA